MNACEASLCRFNTDYLGPYLLHQSSSSALEETVATTEKLITRGKIRRWDVSNLDHADMQELWQLPGENQCVTNQVLYHLGSQGIEHDLLPWYQQQQMLVMAYNPLAQAGWLRNGLLKNVVVDEIARVRNVNATQVLLAWVISHQDVMAISKATTIAHVQQNAAVLKAELLSAKLTMLDRVYPTPKEKTALDMV